MKDETGEEKIKVEFKIHKLDPSLKHFFQFKAICHTWFIVKDQGVEINWKQPLL